MRKLSTILLAVALVLGLAQCKKEQPTPQSESVMITLNVGDNNKGTRANVNPTGADQVTFENGDKILVAYDGHYVGTLEKKTVGSVSQFSGIINITQSDTDQPLYFYFLGNKIDVSTLTAGTTTECTVNISDQSNYPHLPVISMGKSIDADGKAVNYVSGMTSFSSRLYNKCSLMKFNVTTPSTAAICITGMNNEVTVDFTNPTDSGFEYGMNAEDGGLIKMKGGSGSPAEKWAIVLPKDDPTTTTAYSEDGNYVASTSTTINPIVANNYYDSGIGVTVNTIVPESPITTPLTFQAMADGVTIQLTVGGSVSPAPALQYRIGDDEWTDYTNGTSTPAINTDQTISFRAQSGGNTKMAVGTTLGSQSSVFSINGGGCYVYGNVMSLLYQTDFASKTTFPEGSSYSFCELFYGCTNFYSHPTKSIVLPVTTLASHCYEYMFKGCNHMTTAPLLPATTINEYCYWGMFTDCSALTAAPALPATTLANYCYYDMFKGCTNLSSAPELPATTLTTQCYYYMFKDCTNLSSAPELPATTLADNCYFSMFNGCSSLTSTPALPAATLTAGCYYQMFMNCTGLTFVSPISAETMANQSCREMFKGCTNLETPPALPAETMANECYRYMFQNCTKLMTTPVLPATTLAEYCYYCMFDGCTGLVTANEIAATTLASNCCNQMFWGCSNLETIPTLKATTLVTKCYWTMFKNCTKLNNITCLATSGINLGESTSNWLVGVSSSGTFTKVSGANWSTGVSGIPSGWTVNELAPAEQIVDLSTITSPYTAVDGDILINTLGTGVQISIADGATITLRSANINGSNNLSGTFHGLECLGDATIILENNDNFVTANCGSTNGRAGIYVPQHKTLTFEAGNSSGRVVATGAGEAAGIGGYSNTNCGAIVINSGKVTGTAGTGVDDLFEDSYSAGIGSSAYKRCDGITINGGQVIGTGYGNAAGIGTGGNGICRKDGDSDGSQPAITISNTLSNYVKAQKGSSATYFIGGGPSSKCGIVTIGGITYEDGDGNRGISSSTSLSPNDYDITGNTLTYMPF